MREIRLTAQKTRIYHGHEGNAAAEALQAEVQTHANELRSRYAEVVTVLDERGRELLRFSPGGVTPPAPEPVAPPPPNAFQLAAREALIREVQERGAAEDGLRQRAAELGDLEVRLAERGAELDTWARVLGDNANAQREREAALDQRAEELAKRAEELARQAEELAKRAEELAHEPIRAAGGAQ